MRTGDNPGRPFPPCAALVVCSLTLVLASTPVEAQLQSQGKPFLAVLEFDNRLGDSQESRDSRAYLTDVVRNRAKDLLPWLELITKENVVALLAAPAIFKEDLAPGEHEVVLAVDFGSGNSQGGALFGGTISVATINIKYVRCVH